MNTLEKAAFCFAFNCSVPPLNWKQALECRHVEREKYEIFLLGAACQREQMISALREEGCECLKFFEQTEKESQDE